MRLGTQVFASEFACLAKGVSVVDSPEQACQRRVPSACFLHTTHAHASGVPLLPERVQLARVASCDTMLEPEHDISATSYASLI